MNVEEAIRQIDAGEQVLPGDGYPSWNTGLSDLVLWHEVRAWLASLIEAQDLPARAQACIPQLLARHRILNFQHDYQSKDWAAMCTGCDWSTTDKDHLLAFAMHQADVLADAGCRMPGQASGYEWGRVTLDDATVERAARALCSDGDPCDPCLDDARTVLAAAVEADQ